MSIIKCPECRGQVSTMAGTCPHCNTKISGQLRTCPNCGGYCLLTQDKCPECGSTLPSEVQTTSDSSSNKEEKEKQTSRKEKTSSSRKSLVGTLLGFVIVLILCGGGYYYHMQRQQQKEQAAYERLAVVTNPEFYQQFLIDYPDSKHRDEINERMRMLQVEAEDWKQLLKSINRSNISSFMQKHPGSLRQRACEDMLDSIDWHDAQAIGSEEAITDYVAKHPSGRYVSNAAEKKNALLLSKVTSGERAMIRGTLETFFSKAFGEQDIEAARAAIPDTTMNFCGKQNADAEAIVEYARNKLEKDVIGLHYAIGEQMNVRKETLPDGNTGFAVEVSLQETISRIDTNQPTSKQYRVKALLNHEQKIVRLNIFRD